MNRAMNSPELAILAKARRPLSAVFILGVAFLLMWAASMSTASAGQHGDEAACNNNKQCMIDTVGFLPADMSDLTPEELQLVGQNCANPGQSKQTQQSFSRQQGGQNQQGQGMNW